MASCRFGGDGELAPLLPGASTPAGQNSGAKDRYLHQDGPDGRDHLRSPLSVTVRLAGTCQGDVAVAYQFKE